MSISITITDPTNEEALRIADYLYDLAGYGKTVTPTEPDPTATDRLVEVFRNSPGFVSESAPAAPVFQHCQCDPISRSSADQRGSTHLHRFDGDDHLLQTTDFFNSECMRQSGLIDNFHKWM